MQVMPVVCNMQMFVGVAAALAVVTKPLASAALQHLVL
jgi:hypothetical protein